MSGIRIHVVTEGQTETNFVKAVLVPYFENTKVIPCTVVTNIDRKAGRQYKGGISSYQKARNDIEKCMRYTKHAKVFVTTMFDYYHLPTDTPGYDTMQNCLDPYEKVEKLEKAIKTDIFSTKDRDESVFIPYLQLHEFEALLFSDLNVLQEQYFDTDIQPLRNDVSRYTNPELINESKESAPSKRILRYIPTFDKANSGVAVAAKIGLTTLREKCKHFNNWITQLENLYAEYNTKK
jgi:hypothetical protein